MIAAVGVVAEVRLQKIGKKEDFQDNEQDEKFDEDDKPNLFSPFGQVGKSFKVKPENPFEEIHILGILGSNS